MGNDLRTAAQQALEALDAYSWEQVDAARTVLKAALAEPVQEPVASIYITPNGAREFDDWRHDLPVGSNLLYTSPPQRKPLTEEEIDELSRTMVKGDRSVNWLCRAIERAHGIGDNT